MFVKQFGSGPQVFFCLHGWTGDHRSFESLVPWLPREVRLYSSDLPGCGASPDPGYWDLQSITQQIVGALQATGSTSITLVGNCIGALLGMRAALDEPHLVERLVLIDAFAHWPWYFRIFTAPGWGKYAYASTFANPFGRWIVNRALASKRTSQSDLTQGFARRRQSDVALRYLRVVREIQSASDFEPLDVPVDIIFGSRTFRAVRESSLVWREIWPHAHIWELPDAGHLVLQEAAPKVSEIVFKGGVCQPVSVLTSNSTRP